MRLQVFDRPQHEQIVDRLQVWFLLRLPLKALDLLTLLPLDLLQRGDQIHRVGRLCQIFAHAGFNRPLCVIEAAVAAENEDGNGLVDLPDRLDHVKARDVRHLNIGDDDIRFAFIQPVQRAFRVSKGLHLPARMC